MEQPKIYTQIIKVLWDSAVLQHIHACIYRNKVKGIFLLVIL